MEWSLKFEQTKSQIEIHSNVSNRKAKCFSRVQTHKIKQVKCFDIQHVQHSNVQRTRGVNSDSLSAHIGKTFSIDLR